jgi:uncharacterized protein (DUF952 family)
MNSTMVYHLVQPEWWETFANKDYYESETLSEEKFIHLSTFEQINGTLSNYFKGLNRLFLLHIDASKLTSNLVFEDLFETGIAFPHLYGRLNKDAVVEVQELLSNEDGVLEV